MKALIRRISNKQWEMVKNGDGVYLQDVFMRDSTYEWAKGNMYEYKLIDLSDLDTYVAGWKYTYIDKEDK